MESSSESTQTRPAIDTLYGGYYQSLISWQNGDDLKEKLHDIISGGTYEPLTYAGSIPNWQSNSAADQDLYDHEFVDAVYIEDKVAKDGTNTYWQREHAFCASLMCGTTTGEAVKTLGRATDFHNLFASSSSANSSRGNKNYGVADKNALEYTNRTTSNGRDGYSFDAKNFEPGDVDKGRLSRAIFYMATMYGQDEYDEYDHLLYKGLKVVDGYVDYVSGVNCAYAIGNLSTLLEWSSFPVDVLEYQHNESVYSFVPKVHSHEENNHAQGNRNPYVDFPGLVDYVFGAKKNEPGSLSDVISSYETLEIEKEGTRYYAIESAKRQYDEDEVFSREDLSVVRVAYDGKEAPFAGFDVYGVEENKPFAQGGEVGIIIRTDINEIEYTVLVETDPVLDATWHHLLTGKTDGGDFKGIDSQSGVTHELLFDGLWWKVTWASGVIGNYNSDLGCKFGTAAKPAQTITFESKEAFNLDGHVNVDAMYLRGAAASGKSYTVSFYMDDELLFFESLGYIDTKTPLTLGKKLTSTKTGKAKFVISNITAHVNIQYLAVNAE